MVKAAHRLLHSLLLLAGVSVFSFLLLSLAPGNFFDELRLNPQISPATVAALEAQYGVNRPLPMRYAHWLASLARGQFGYSLSYRCDVGSLIFPRARNTLLLTSAATLLAWVVALLWGTLEALNRGKWLDRFGGACTSLLLAIPDLLLGLLLLILAARAGRSSVSALAVQSSEGPISATFSRLFLPLLALTLGALPILVRHVRSAMVAALDAPFVQAARAHGIPSWRIVFRHALPAALNSLLSLLGFSIGGLLSMSLLTEIILGWPGLGPLVLEAMFARDTYVVMAAVMLSSLFLILGNLIADLLLYWNDPRIRAVPA
ncbi:MAG TPA: ABC transporter permease [Candidatus Acidoferrales bacterium]|nr:ABC transporter permease [Candidatus Acidoferrales bacterium]